MSLNHGSLKTRCDGWTRRDCIQLGLGSLVAGGFVGTLRATESSKSPVKSCILVWLDGGPTHYETFDPKPDAPAEIRGEYETIDTRIPGVQFSRHMKKTAQIADRLAIVRSIRHNQGNHGAGNHYMMTGAPPRIPVGCGAFVSFHPSMGSVAAYEKSAPAGLPAYFSMPRMSRSGGPNFLGAKFAPFVVSENPNSSGFRVRDVALPNGLDGQRFLGRKSLRQQMDTLKRIRDQRAGDPTLSVDEFYHQGYELVTSPKAQEAFAIDREPASTRNRYGRHGFGQRALLARRLVEAGVPWITLYDGGWDHHRTIFSALNSKLPPVDATIATLVQDLEERGMLDSTLVVVLGEFGRTPKVNSRGGRDHWSNAMSVMFAGGRTPGGQVIGATDRQGYTAIDNILAPENFVSTVYSKLGINPGKILHTPQGRPVHLVSDHRPIRELMG